MAQPVPSAPAPVPMSAVLPAQAQKYFELASALMQQYNVPPYPEAYAVWFHYVDSRNKDLVKEIDTMINNKVPFSAGTMSFLHSRFVAADRTQDAISESAGNANKILGEVLKMVQQFGASTSEYTSDVGNYMTRIESIAEEGGVQDVVKQLLSATATLKQSGTELTQKLEESKKEAEVLRKNLEEVTQESQRDFLTGVYNRKAYDKLLNEQLQVAASSKTELCLLMMDIDHFKQFNDKFGHLLGDEVLKIVAKSLTDCVRGRDVVARYGGEEFSVVLPATPMIGAMKVAEAIRTTIASRELKRRDTGESYGAINVSIGVAAFRRGIDTAQALMKRADDALYHSKTHGRNRVTQELD